jgi:hypothetical protein
VPFVAGKVGSAAQFSNSAYGVVQGSARAVLGVYPQYTISLWVNVSTSPDTQHAYFDINNRSVAPYGGIQLSVFSATQSSICAASTSNPYLTGSCPIYTGLTSGAWHNVIVRYAGTGVSAGQGANVEVYHDDVLVETVANDSANDPVFSQGIIDTLYIGSGGVTLDEIRVYNNVFTVANQCTQIIGGTWTGAACTLP